MAGSTKVNRQIALGAIRSQMRKIGLDPLSQSAEVAIEILDDIAREDAELVASQWYLAAGESQIRLFKAEWRKSQTRY